MKKNAKILTGSLPAADSNPAASAYARAGVDIDEMMRGLESAKPLIRGTATAGVLSEIGSFGGLFASPGRDSILVASTDGVGTKLKVAVMARRHDTVGQDLVNHCVNDILVQGAEPLFFLDYVGAAHLKADMFRDVLAGICKACKANGCALLGGETAEMPGLYPSGEYDLVGTIIGKVNRRDLVTGKDVRPGDALIGLPSTGLHTNGYSLARKVIFETARLKPSSRLPGSTQTVGEALLAVHRSYLKSVLAVRRAGVKIRGMVHITGGGFYDNIPRVLPKGTAVVVGRSAWKVPRVFSFIQEAGRVSDAEMFRVFNMGIGYILICRGQDVRKTLSALARSGTRGTVIGSVVKGNRDVTVTP